MESKNGNPVEPKSYIKASDVELVLHKDKGADAIFKSFEIKDFTSKGDNYSSIVTSVIVQYALNGKDEKTSFVVKLDPCRGTEGFGALAATLVDKEMKFYGEIIPEINSELKKLNRAELKVPKVYLTVGKEVIYMEDMRKSGYKMCDRKKGLDYKHTNLIMNELGRFHASSALYLRRSSLEGTNQDKNPAMREAFEIMQGDNNMMQKSVDQTCKIIDALEGYGFVSDFMRSNEATIDDEMKKQLEVTECFKVICHGDCWNNNFLFKYDEDGHPYDCCLLDLQVTRVGSPALDLNYMLYCSMKGEIRTKYFDSFLAQYYASFASIFSEAGQCVPFTLSSLTTEFYEKNFYGLMMGMILIPIVLVDPEDAPSFDDYKNDDISVAMDKFQKKMMEVTLKSPALKSRLLAMFDEMKDSGLFDEKKEVDIDPSLTSYDLIKSIDVSQALKKACGDQCQLISFEIKDFTQKGDNYACIVSSIRVKYSLNDEKKETSFVVKLNPVRGKAMGGMSDVMFDKEIDFYRTVLGNLNEVLRDTGNHELRLPKYFWSVSKKGVQVIYLEDMRTHGFKMCDRHVGMDEHHTYLIMKELGRFHSASIIWMASEENKDRDLLKKYPKLQEAMTLITEDSPIDLTKMFEEYLERSAHIAEQNKGYEHVAKYLRDQKGEIENIYWNQLKCTDNFKVICHGDCWNNNFLFKYDKNGKPTECCLLDFQVTRIGSPALDMNYMLFCSLSGEVRNNHMEEFFAHYYSTFSSVLASANKPTPFTLKELEGEFKRKNFFGLLMGMTLIPIVLMDSEDAPTLDATEGKDMAEVFQEFQAKAMEITLRSPNLTPRFLSMFDDMKRYGLFDQ